MVEDPIEDPVLLVIRTSEVVASMLRLSGTTEAAAVAAGGTGGHNSR